MGNAPCETPGVRYNQDFIIEIPRGVDGLVNLGGIESPGLTSSPAIARRVVELLHDAGESLVEKPDWQPIRPPRPRFRDLTQRGPRAIDRQRPGLWADHLPLRDGQRRRDHRRNPRADARAHLRRDQTPHLAGHRALPGRLSTCRAWSDCWPRELGIPPEQVTKKGPGSEFLVRPTKQVEV